MNNSKHNAMKSLILPIRQGKSDSHALQWIAATPIEWIDTLTSIASTKTGNHGEEVTVETRQNSPGPRRKAVWNRRMDGVDSGVDASAIPLSAEASRRLQAVPVYCMPRFWSFGSFRASPIMEEIRLLILAIEGQWNFAELKFCLKRIRDEFFAFVPQRRSRDFQATEAFHKHCCETVQKLQALLELGLRLENTPGDVDPTEAATMVAATPPRLSKTSVDLSFEMYMLGWLKKHWLNPYPDAEVYQDLIRMTDKTQTEIEDWLTHARENVWLPAIAEAYEMGRPSKYLWEDSIHIAFPEDSDAQDDFQDEPMEQDD